MIIFYHIMTITILNLILFEEINKYIKIYFSIAPNVLNNDVIISIGLRNRNSDWRSSRIYFYQNRSSNFYCTIVRGVSYQYLCV